ncbi:MAG: hypothetical protein VKP70_01520, partial [Cyanobacteriota bacterium]|nr:hypothetical protein [Cyanobacteriota bacterium]
MTPVRWTAHRVLRVDHKRVTMRLLHFLPVYAPAWQFGGPVLSVSRLCEGLARLGVEVEVITTNAGLPDWPE